MKKTCAAVGSLLVSVVFASMASAEGVPWLDQQYPYDFLFGNHIDTHQQTKVMPDGELMGFLYIEFTGEYTAEGYPIAKHTDCNDPQAECSVGWTLRAKPGAATFVHHDKDHPVWLVDSRSDIPQPGAFSHFHWLGYPEMAKNLMEDMKYDGYFIELKAKDTFAFQHGGEEILVSPGLDLATHLNIVSSFPGANGGGDTGTHTH